MVNKEKLSSNGAAAKSNPQKAMGLDPFADMEDLIWGQDQLFSKPNQETTARSLDKTEIEPNFEPAIAEIESPLEIEAANEQTSVEVEPPLEIEAANEQTPVEVEPPLEIEAANEQTPVEVEPPLQIEAANEPTSVEVEPPLQIEAAEAETIALALEETGAEPETENSKPVLPILSEAEESKIQNPKSKIQTESHFLDELIATIDQEVEQAFGSDVMADLAAVAPEDQEGRGEQHLIFTLAGTDYAVPISNVTEIGQPLITTPTPNVPAWVLGVVNLRGDIISMVDLRMFLDLEKTVYDRYSRILVAQAHYEDMTTALLVDRVNEIRYLDLERITNPTAPIEDQVSPYLRGVYEHNEDLLVVLDFDKLLLSSKMQQFQTV